MVLALGQEPTTLFHRGGGWWCGWDWNSIDFQWWPWVWRRRHVGLCLLCNAWSKSNSDWPQLPCSTKLQTSCRVRSAQTSKSPDFKNICLPRRQDTCKTVWYNKRSVNTAFYINVIYCTLHPVCNHMSDDIWQQAINHLDQEAQFLDGCIVHGVSVGVNMCEALHALGWLHVKHNIWYCTFYLSKGSCGPCNSTFVRMPVNTSCQRCARRRPCPRPHLQGRAGWEV